MHITITGRHHEVSTMLRTYATRKLERLGRFSRKLDEIHLIIWPERYRMVAEITVHDKRFRAVATAQAPQEQAAFDLALEKIEGHLRRHKERIAGHPHRRGEAAA